MAAQLQWVWASENTLDCGRIGPDTAANPGHPALRANDGFGHAAGLEASRNALRLNFG